VKMFIWESAYRVKYGNAVAVAVAEDVDQAREMLKKAEVSPYGMNPIMADGSRHHPPGCDVGKEEPTRIYDLPCAEIFHWEE
jgi:hypothetical protein